MDQIKDIFSKISPIDIDELTLDLPNSEDYPGWPFGWEPSD